jgi:hypothetical protein
MGLDAASVEKDFWVCWTLREIFSDSRSIRKLPFSSALPATKTSPAITTTSPGSWVPAARGSCWRWWKPFERPPEKIFAKFEATPVFVPPRVVEMKCRNAEIPTAMIRRTFFQTLAAALLPRPVIAMAKTLQPACERAARASHSPAPIQDSEWLQEWREIPKLEIFAKDLPYHEDPHQRDLGEVILRHIGEGIPISFRYAGGSEPGAVRTVLPTLLFSPDLCPYRMCYEDPTELPDPSQTPIYLLGWCQIRQAARNFRLDRMADLTYSLTFSGIFRIWQGGAGIPDPIFHRPL